MPKRRPSAKQSSVSRQASSGPEFSTLALDIIGGLDEGTANFRGEKTLPSRTILIPKKVNVAAVRRKTGLSQTQFADRFGFNLRTLQEWEQGRTAPDTAVRAYLRVIERQPDAVNRALAL